MNSVNYLTHDVVKQQSIEFAHIIETINQQMYHFEDCTNAYQVPRHRTNVLNLLRHEHMHLPYQQDASFSVPSDQ